MNAKKYKYLSVGMQFFVYSVKARKRENTNKVKKSLYDAFLKAR